MRCNLAASRWRGGTLSSSHRKVAARRDSVKDGMLQRCWNNNTGRGRGDGQHYSFTFRELSEERLDVMLGSGQRAMYAGCEAW